MTSAEAFPQRFADLKATFVRPPLAEKYVRPPLALPPRSRLSPELAAAVDAAGGRDECNRRLELWSKYREEYLIAMLDEPIGSPFRTVHGAELFTSSNEPILLVHCHIGQLRLFRDTVRRIVGDRRPWASYMRPPPPLANSSTEVVWPGDSYLDPAGSLAGVQGLAALRRGNGILSYMPDADLPVAAKCGLVTTTFAGMRRRRSLFLPLAIRATTCRVVFGVVQLRWPLEDGVDIRFFEPVTRGELLALDDEHLLRRILAECEQMIYANIWTWAQWQFFSSGLPAR